MTETSDKCNKSHSFTKAQQQGADSSNNNINIKNYRRHLWFAKTVALTLQVHFTVHRRELYVKQLGRVSNILNAQHSLFNHYWNNQNPLLMLTLGFNDYAWSGLRKCLGPTLALALCSVFCIWRLNPLTIIILKEDIIICRSQLECSISTYIWLPSI